jgi:hypothetical protein
MSTILEVRSRRHDFICHPVGRPELWESGSSSAEAVGMWIVSRGPKCGIEVRWPDSPPKGRELNISAHSCSSVVETAKEGTGA